MNKPGLFKRLGMAITGKGLYDLHPELRYREHIFSSARGVNLYGENKTAYKGNSWVRRSVNIIADGIAPLTVSVVNSDDQPQERHHSHASEAPAEHRSQHRQLPHTPRLSAR